MNKYSFYTAWSEEDQGYIATCQEFPGLSAFGDTAKEAIAEAEVALELMIEAYNEDGISLPPPVIHEEYSGQFRVRIPKSLHRRLVEEANMEGVSLNQFVATTLAEKVGIVHARRVASSDMSQINSQRQRLVRHLLNARNSLTGAATPATVEQDFRVSASDAIKAGTSNEETKAYIH